MILLQTALLYVYLPVTDVKKKVLFTLPFDVRVVTPLADVQRAQSTGDTLSTQQPSVPDVAYAHSGRIDSSFTGVSGRM